MALAAKRTLWSQLAWFTWAEARCCLSPFAVIACLGLTKIVTIPGIARYDTMLGLCLAIQAAMLGLGLETFDEFKVLGVFHILGLGLELHKTSIGAWSYPDAGLLRIGSVPVFSGFMYASVASYVCQAWRVFRLQMTGMPSPWTVWTLAIAGYANFFTRPWLPDLRWPIIGLTLLALRRATVRFDLDGVPWRMPLALSLALVAGFLWLAENLATALGAWQYPHQANGWHPVEGSKAASWYLLMLVSFLLVARLKAIKAHR